MGCMESEARKVRDGGGRMELRLHDDFMGRGDGLMGAGRMTSEEGGCVCTQREVCMYVHMYMCMYTEGGV